VASSSDQSLPVHAIRGLAGRVAALLVLGAASAVALQAIGYATAPVLVQ
jgi:hypothetical protein